MCVAGGMRAVLVFEYVSFGRNVCVAVSVGGNGRVAVSVGGNVCVAGGMLALRVFEFVSVVGGVTKARAVIRDVRRGPNTSPTATLAGRG